jgi:hypothetical protein
VVSIYDRHSETFELCHISEGFSNILMQRASAGVEQRFACYTTECFPHDSRQCGTADLPAAKWHTASLLSVEVMVVCVRHFS